MKQLCAMQEWIQKKKKSKNQISAFVLSNKNERDNYHLNQLHPNYDHLRKVASPLE